MTRKKSNPEKKLEVELWKIVERLDDDNDYNYPEAVRDIKEVFGVTATVNAVREWKQTGDAKGALRVIEAATGEPK